MDEMVLETQHWLNDTYGGRSGFNYVYPSGQTGWETMYGLTRALQLELGIINTADSFGPTTLNYLDVYGPISLSSNNDASNQQNVNIIKIIQGGLYCKGYSPGGITGYFGPGTDLAIKSIQSNIGLNELTGVVTPKLFKAILTMDAYIVVNNGSSVIREIQQFLNRTYNHRKNFFFGPCDGHFSRDTQKALVYAIQYEEGLPDSVANGNFGPTTRSELPVLELGDSDSDKNFVRLYQASLIFNNQDSPFDGVFSQEVANATRIFQEFAKLPVTGKADYQTWASLLVSTGDPNRRGDACDTSTEVTFKRGLAIKNAGYDIVGRYLTNAHIPDPLNKKIQPGELDQIFGAGLSVFPIFQTYGGDASYFGKNQGRADAIEAFNAAKEYGFPEGTTIYFAVDFDAMNYQITDNVLPYFKAVSERLTNLGGFYNVGVYGPRNVCIRVSQKGYATKSFVSGMSTGFSGNLGFPLPQNWAFDQISTIGVGAGESYIEIDNNIVSGRDTGVTNVNPEQTVPDETWMALYNAWLDVASNFPVFNEKPSLFTTNFNFNRRYNVISTSLVDVDVETSTTFTMPGSNDVHAIEVNNGTLGMSSSEILGDAKTKLSTSQIDQYENLLENVALSVGNGFVEFTLTPIGDKLEVRVTAYKDDVQVGDNVLKLKVDVIYSISNLEPVDPEPGLGTLLGTLAVGTVALGVLIYFAPAVLGIGLAGATAVGLFSFLTGDAEDDNEA
ncbi:DUF1906 domain-containing protein [Sediminibacillus dalangtanensis]|uniref:DUF1906 domain-containing protein n=1 Tax=Sediminibacillus dalangtanensis TaxID=2729421 RepID=A0ABX7VX70_9BACI|nr:glycoside hydrolase domain-containing protein [Sediminibacillus dalangtanensis]QTN01134.1 DUF1906 domain-containing protein [Sediminibacillus dalangtanensis]